MRLLSKILLLSLSLVYSLNVSAQTEAQTEKSAEALQLIKVAELETPEKNQSFQKTLNGVQQKKQTIQIMKQTLSSIEDPVLKGLLENEINRQIGLLNDANKQMFDEYGFSITRNYEIVIEKSSIYMYVSAEEAAKIEAANAPVVAP
jgi:hypothetical protein